VTIFLPSLLAATTTRRRTSSLSLHSKVPHREGHGKLRT
jgi:hypothetical protein